LWAVPVLAGTMVRVGIVAVIGFVIFLFASPSEDVFLLTLLMSVLAVLVIDVMMVLSLIKSVEEHSEERATEMLASEGQA
jgi:ABC-type transport system involved in multi-copper enzyme maturation permease subunit